MKNMALVVSGVVHGTGRMQGHGRHAGNIVDGEGPYGISVAFHSSKQTLRVTIFLKDDYADNREQSATDTDTQPR